MVDNLIEDGPRNGLEPSATTASSVSDFLGYGSYSGADIKVIVHYPPSILINSLEEKRRKELSSQLPALVEEFNTISVTGSPREVQDIREQIEALNAELESVDVSIEEIQNLPTSKVLGEIQTISWSTHREKAPVRTLGSVYPRAYTRGPRCIPETEKVYIKYKGYISIKEVVLGDMIHSEGKKFHKVMGCTNEGIKECYDLKLNNGFKLRASFDHPIMTDRGWIEMQYLKKTDKVFVSSLVPSHNKDLDESENIIKMIAFLIGDGSTHNYEDPDKKKMNYRIGLSISCQEDFIKRETEECLETLNIGFNDNKDPNGESINRIINVCEIGYGQTDWKQRRYNLLHKKLLEYDLYNRYSHQKIIPYEFMDSLSKSQLRIFLRRLFSTDGCYSISKDKKHIEFQYSSTSEELIDQIRLLLNKFGLSSIKNLDKKVGDIGGRKEIVSKHNSFKLIVSDALELVRFVKRVGIFGKDKKILPHLDLLKSRIKYHFVNCSHDEYLNQIKQACIKTSTPIKQFDRKFGIYNKHLKLTPRRLLAISKELKIKEFDSFVNKKILDLIDLQNDFILLSVKEIAKTYSLPVYDIEVKDKHSFICNHIKVHNTIAGSMVFTLFHEHVLHEVLNLNLGIYNTGTSDHDPYLNTTNLPDQLPPLDISLVFANEYGAISHMGLWGLEFVQEGATFSIQDIFSESIVQYVARDMDPMRVASLRKLDGQGVTDAWTDSASGLTRRKKEENAHLKKRNPFL